MTDPATEKALRQKTYVRQHFLSLYRRTFNCMPPEDRQHARKLARFVMRETPTQGFQDHAPGHALPGSILFAANSYACMVKPYRTAAQP